MNRRDAIRRWAAVAVGAVIGAFLPRSVTAEAHPEIGECGPDGWPIRMHASSQGAHSVKGVYVNGVKQDDAVAFDREEGWVEWLDREFDWLPRRTYGRITLDVQPLPWVTKMKAT
jgi:hypothetical protein